MNDLFFVISTDVVLDDVHIKTGRRNLTREANVTCINISPQRRIETKLLKSDTAKRSAQCVTSKTESL